MVLGGLISGAFGLIGASKSANAATDAAQIAADEAARQYDISRGDSFYFYDQNRQLLSPYVESSGRALGELNAFMGLGDISATAGGFDPATGMWRGSVPYQYSDPNNLPKPVNSFSGTATPQQAEVLPPGTPGGENSFNVTPPQRVYGIENGAGGYGGLGGYFSTPAEGERYAQQQYEIDRLRYDMERAQQPTATPAAPPEPVPMRDPGAAASSASDRYNAFNERLYGEFEADPGYGFRQQEGQKAVENAAAARGGVLSGAAMKAAMDYNSGLASQEYGNWFNRKRMQGLDYLGQLGTMSGLGAAATAVGANQGTQNALLSAGNQASSTIAGANLAGGRGASNAFLQGYGYAGEGFGDAISGAIGWGAGLYG